MTLPPFLYAFRPILRDLAPTFIFLIVLASGGSPLLATRIAMAIGLGHLAFNFARRTPVEALQWLSAALVLIFGSATLVTHDPRFIMAKPTLIFAAVGATMLKPGWQAAYVPPIAAPHLPAAALKPWGFAWAGLMFALAGANAALALTAPVEAWATFSSFAPMGAMIVLFLLQYAFLRRRVVAAIRASGAQPCSTASGSGPSA